MDPIVWLKFSTIYSGSIYLRSAGSLFHRPLLRLRPPLALVIAAFCSAIFCSCTAVNLPESEADSLNISIFDDVHCLDLAAQPQPSWSKLSVAAPPRNGHSITALGSAGALLFGGSDDNGPNNSIYLFDRSGPGGHWRWQCLDSDIESAKPQARELHAAVWLPASGELIISGGRGAEEMLHDCWAFSLADRRWRLLGQCPQRCSHSLAVLPAVSSSSLLPISSSVSLISFGGSDGLAFFNELAIYNSSGVRPDQSLSGWCEQCNGPPGWKLLAGHSSGQDVENNDKRSSQQSESELPAPRFAHALVSLSSDSVSSSPAPSVRLLLFGGLNAEQDFNDIWILNIKSIDQSNGETREQKTVDKQ